SGSSCSGGRRRPMAGPDEVAVGDGGDPRAQQERVPAVICSHVHVTYRVFGAGRGKVVDEQTSLARLLNRGAQQVGVREVHAVKDVSFVAYQGESVGLIGRNGSGKSTLLRAVAGLIPDRKSTRLNSSHVKISYAVFCLKKKKE